MPATPCAAAARAPTSACSRAPAGRQVEADAVDGGLLREDREVGRLGAGERVPHGHGDALLEPDLAADGVDEVVDPRDALGVRALEPRRTQHRALDADGGPGAGEVDDGRRGGVGELAGPDHLGGVEVEAGPAAGHGRAPVGGLRGGAARCGQGGRVAVGGIRAHARCRTPADGDGAVP